MCGNCTWSCTWMHFIQHKSDRFYLKEQDDIKYVIETLKKTTKRISFTNIHYSGSLRTTSTDIFNDSTWMRLILPNLLSFYTYYSTRNRNIILKFSSLQCMNGTLYCLWIQDSRFIIFRFGNMMLKIGIWHNYLFHQLLMKKLG